MCFVISYHGEVPILLVEKPDLPRGQARDYLRPDHLFRVVAAIAQPHLPASGFGRADGIVQCISAEHRRAAAGQAIDGIR